MKGREPQVYWQGPTVGWDFGGNGSRTFTLCYNLQYPREIFRRFPGVEGSAYFIGGLGVNYQRADESSWRRCAPAWACGWAPTSATWPMPQAPVVPVLSTWRLNPVGGECR